jgi:hypothetical protein
MNTPTWADLKRGYQTMEKLSLLTPDFDADSWMDLLIRIANGDQLAQELFRGLFIGQVLPQLSKEDQVIFYRYLEEMP